MQQVPDKTSNHRFHSGDEVLGKAAHCPEPNSASIPTVRDSEVPEAEMVGSRTNEISGVKLLLVNYR